jgi:hypothetical protein
MHKTIQIAVGAVLLAVALTSHAALVRWTLHDVTFADGSTASGFFTVDTNQPIFGNFGLPEMDIHVTEGAGFTGTTYFDDSGIGIFAAYSHNGTLAHTNSSVFTDGRQRVLTLALPDITSHTSGSADLIAGTAFENVPRLMTGSGEESRFFPNGGFDSVRVISRGTITASVVAEPSSFALLSIGVAVVLLLLFRPGLIVMLLR